MKEWCYRVHWKPQLKAGSFREQHMECERLISTPSVFNACNVWFIILHLLLITLDAHIQDGFERVPCATLALPFKEYREYMLFEQVKRRNHSTYCIGSSFPCIPLDIHRSSWPPDQCKCPHFCRGFFRIR